MSRIFIIVLLIVSLHEKTCLTLSLCNVIQAYLFVLNFAHFNNSILLETSWKNKNKKQTNKQTKQNSKKKRKQNIFGFK